MIAVSFLKSIYDQVETIKRIDESMADFIHVDLMDGLYVKENNYKDTIVNDLKKTHKPLDIHLMVKEPLKYLEKLTSLPHIHIVTFHLDSTNNPLAVINYLKEKKIKVGLAINPDEEVTILNSYLDLIDYVLIMSVYPGLGGQEFIPSVLEKINNLPSNILIGIDGGVNEKTINFLKDYALYNIVSGSYICMSSNFNKQIQTLKEALKK